MAALRYINKIKRINRLIKLKATGNPRELASKLGISERKVYDYIRNMKDLGAPIAYSYSEQSYIYYEAGELKIGFSFEILGDRETDRISGGMMTPFLIILNSLQRNGQNRKRFNTTAEMLQCGNLPLL